MANIQFPNNPTNGEKVTVNGKVFTYNSTKQKWVATRLNISGRPINIPSNANPIINFELDSLSFDTAGQVKDIVYNYSDPDGGVVFFDSISNSGFANTSVANVEHFAANNTVRITVGSEAFIGSITVRVSDGRSTATATANVAGSFGFDWSGTVLLDDTLQADDTATLFDQGFRCAIDPIDGSSIISTCYDGTGVSASGGAYIFVNNGSSWVQQGKLLPPTITGNINFGWSCAICGDYAVIGAPRDPTTFKGSAYVYQRSGETWTFMQKLVDPNGDNYHNFGASVSIYEDTIAVGATGALGGLGGTQSGAGAVFIFTRSGSTWTLQTKLYHNSSLSDYFGESVCLRGTTLAASDIFIDNRQGHVIVFTGSGSSWTQQAILEAPAGDRQDDDTFGQSIDIDGDTLIVSAMQDDESITNGGAIYVFDRNGSNWTLNTKLMAPSPISSERLGHAKQTIGISQDTIVGSTNANSKRVFVWTRTDNVWTLAQTITHEFAGLEPGSNFGQSCGIFAGYIAVSDHTVSTGGSAAGAVYVFTVD